MVGCKARRVPAAVHSAGVDRPGHGTSHGLQNGGLFAFTSKFALLTMVAISKHVFDFAMDSQYTSLRVNFLSVPLL